jgi:hypothetical protein
MVERWMAKTVTEVVVVMVTVMDMADTTCMVYRLHFITMDACALFLPVELHVDMVFYVHISR